VRIKTEKVKILKYCGLLTIYGSALIIIFLRPLDAQIWQWADDAMYFQNALAIFQNIGNGHWLGPFNKVVISKPPFFSVFIGAVHHLRIPLRLAEFLLFAPLPFFFWMAVRPLKIGKWIIFYLATFCVVFIPVAGLDSRLVRGTLFGALALYCLISLCGIIIISGSRSRKALSWWAILAGLALGLAVTTRAEALWLMAPTGLAILFTFILEWRSGKLSNCALFVSLICIGYVVPCIFFSTLNYSSYGVFSPSLRQNSAFINFHTILCSLQPNQRKKYVPINTKTRELAYSISPTFAQLKPYLEGPDLDPIARNKAHLWINGWGNISGGREFFVSNFQFALNEAIILSGRDTGKAFLDFCRQATKEIRVAIKNERIEHGRLGFSMLPPLLIADLTEIFSASFKSFFLLIGKGLYREKIHKSASTSVIADDWHSYLRTWPLPSSDVEQHSIITKNQFFNFGVDMFRISYPFFLILGLLAGVRAWLNKCEHYQKILMMLILSWSAILSFCFVIGIVDTLGFPLLKNPGGYNRMGFFPLHFLLLVSVISFFYTIKAGPSWKTCWHFFPKYTFK